MNNTARLSQEQAESVCKLASDHRNKLGFIDKIPLANHIYGILDELNIRLLQYPVKSEGKKPTFSSVLLYSEADEAEFTFIGLNSADYFDRQIFAIANELYHYYTNTGVHLSRLDDEKQSLGKAKAKLFAIEFLLPESELKRIAFNEQNDSILSGMPKKALLRFIARLHCTWVVPYRLLIEKLKEIQAISEKQYNQLHTVDERDLDGEYGMIGKAVNKEIFLMLNTITSNIGSTPNDIEVIIRNFEEYIIDEYNFINALKLLDRTPDEFGYAFFTKNQVGK
ncbi:ImmA/IrrE family metallo-endopeptidase [Virgibacillus halodenitrificans]|uniref:ImmA/IrrE family metallo-endopeptidase n=1 Tax=Virgibacillus halodenitrificans TaxID=1482 RepID=UPI002DBF59A1|nr:ImmA/IrrE family metallo-endopeptidase [Virgibacillus halodenitrificans]MEC2159381.1 ImmA/IrrE family metallo-endopeptidase [Virgibacillus halodenitrificans]